LRTISESTTVPAGEPSLCKVAENACFEKEQSLIWGAYLITQLLDFILWNWLVIVELLDLSVESADIAHT